MYEDFYGFRERPFTLLPDPDFLFLDEKHRTALEMLETAVSDRTGFCVISGEIGAGKTTLIRELLNRLDETVCVGLVSNTHPSFGGLLQWIMAAYGLSCGDSDELDLHKRFIEFAIQQFAQKKHTLLIIDEAQNLSVEALEELRTLSDVNTERDLILQVILVGQQQLRDALEQPELEQFSRGVTLNYHLQALDQDETCLYIQHRVSHAGGQTDLFSTDACQAVYRLSGGIPRVINRLCDLSLVYGCTAQSRIITAELVDRVGEDQRMGSLLDIPQVDPEVAIPEQTEQSVNTIAGSVSPVLMPELEAEANRKEDSAEKAVPSELHQLVVNAEKKKPARGERGALWLLLGVVVLAGGTGWLMRDFQSADSVASPAPAPVTAAVEKEKSIAPVISENSQVTPPEGKMPQGKDNQPLSVADKATSEKQDAGKDAEAEAAQQRAARLSRQAEETARLKKESDRMQREQRAAEQRLAKQRAARKELEREARLEREKMAAAKAEAAARQRDARLSRQAEETARLKKESDRMKREQRAAEQRLAKQRAARKELERKARLEREKMAAAKEAAKKLAEERTRAGTGSPGKTAQKPVPRKPVETGKAPVGFVEAAVPSYDEDDGEAIVLDAKARFASEDAEGVVAPAVRSTTALAEDDGDAVAQTDNEGEVGFAANPCNGPTARFLSTCR